RGPAPLPPAGGAERLPAPLSGTCSHCGAEVEIPATAWGTTTPCPRCASQLRVPGDLLAPATVTAAKLATTVPTHPLSAPPRRTGTRPFALLGRLVRRPRWLGAVAAVALLAGLAAWLATRKRGEDAGGLVRTFQGHGGRVMGVAFSPDGRLALS